MRKTGKPGNGSVPPGGRRRGQKGGIPVKKWFLSYAAASEKGSRENNQDNLRVGAAYELFNTEKPVWVEGSVQAGPLELFCVCDGIGGGAVGEMAAATALGQLSRALAASLEKGESTAEAALTAAEFAQSGVLELYGMLRRSGGCTLSLVALRGNEFAAANIGDSPIFLLKDGEEEPLELSCRHTLAWRKRELGIPTEAADECCLLRYVGKPGRSAAQMAHITGGTLGPRDSLLLCTDGLTDALPVKRLWEAAKKPGALRSLVKRAARQRGSDNCTAICLRAAQIEASETEEGLADGKQDL